MGEIVYVNLFGELQPFTLRRADSERYKDEPEEIVNGKLTDEEVGLLKWLVDDLKTEDIADEVLAYCNDIYENISYYNEESGEYEDAKPIEKTELLDEVALEKVYLNVRGGRKFNHMPDISIAGECSCDEDHGMAIGFRNKKFLAVGSEDFSGF